MANNEITIEDIFQELTLKKLLNEGERYWIGISGSWRKTNKEIERDVRESVRKIFALGGGIVTGGALSVDYFATDEALKIDREAKGIRVCLPLTVERFIAHYHKRASEGVITTEQAEIISEQLLRLKNANPGAILENLDNIEANQKTYYERNTVVVNLCDALLSFQVNDSAGTEDAIEKALKLGKPVRKLKYIIE